MGHALQMRRGANKKKKTDTTTTASFIRNCIVMWVTQLALSSEKRLEDFLVD